MKIQNILIWIATITGTALLIDTMRIKKWIALPIYVNNLVIPIPQGPIDFKFDGSKIKIGGTPGAYRVEFPLLEVFYKGTPPKTFITWQMKPFLLPSEIVSQLSILRILYAFRDMKISVIGTSLHVSIPKNIKVPIYW